MKNENIFRLTSLIRNKRKSTKDILWVGDNRHALDFLSADVDRIEYVNTSNCENVLKKKKYQLIIFNLNPEQDFYLNFNVAKIEKDKTSKKLVLISNEKTLQETSGTPAPIWLDKKESANTLFKLLNSEAISEVLFLPENEAKVRSVIQQAFDEIGAQDESAHQIQDVEQKVSKTRALVRFVKALTGVANVDDLMHILLNENKSFQKIKEPILAFAKSQHELQLLYFQGTRLVSKTTPGVWPQQIKIRLNDVTDSQYLANIFGRPFAKLLTIPLQLRRKSTEDPLKVSAVLFFEHAMSSDEMNSFLEFIEERLLPVSIALDRLLLEQDLNETSLLWERTFDGLQDPVAIFDIDGQVLRANKAFATQLGHTKLEDLQGESLLINDKLFEVHSYPIALTKDSLPTNIINHYVDITLAHRLQKQMIQNEKMAALGHLAGNIAHELNNPLTGIRSLAQLLIAQTHDKKRLNEDLQEVEKATERCQIIIKNLLDFSRGEIDDQKSIASANAIVNKTLPLLKTLISRFDVHLELTEDNCDILVEPHLMQQVIFNIIKNAAQAMGESGTLTIQTRIVDGRVQLIIKDTGEGIAKEALAKIFDFFFTTKSSGQGTGLGLSMSKSIIDRFNGTIEVFSEVGKGSEFVISLPRADSRTLDMRPT